MNFSEALYETKEGKKVTREKWENDKTKRYKYIQIEHGKCIAFLKDDKWVKRKAEYLLELRKHNES